MLGEMPWGEGQSVARPPAASFKFSHPIPSLLSNQRAFRPGAGERSLGGQLVSQTLAMPNILENIKEQSESSASGTQDLARPQSHRAPTDDANDQATTAGDERAIAATNLQIHVEQGPARDVEQAVAAMNQQIHIDNGKLLVPKDT